MAHQKRAISEHLTEKRRSTSYDGPMALPPQFRDNEEWHYRWCTFDENRPQTLVKRLKMGYQPIPQSEIGDTLDLLKSFGIMADSSKESQKHIYITDKKGIVSYLLRMPIEIYNELKDQEDQEVNYREQNITGKLQEATGNKESRAEKGKGHIFDPYHTFGKSSI